VDSGVREGQVIGVDYDPMLAKLIVHAETREAAIARMTEALKAFAILGVRHNVPFLLALINLPEVRMQDTREYRVDTGLIERRLADLSSPPDDAVRAAAEAVGKLVQGTNSARAQGPSGAAIRADDPWETIVW